MQKYNAKEWGINPADVCPHSLQVQNKLLQHGHESYIVGGCIRDLLLNLTPKDFDVATSAHPQEICKLFARSRPIGKRFKIVHVRAGRTTTEVSTFRDKNKSDGKFLRATQGQIIRDNSYGTLQQDIQRRDFTVNAMYYNPIDNVLITHEQSKQDLHDRRLRLINPADSSFREDPVRMLRAVRFQAKLGFHIEEECRRHIKQLCHLLALVPKARRFTELVKMFSCGDSAEALRLVCAFKLLDYLHPLASDEIEKNNLTFIELLRLLLKNTDDRIRNKQPTTPAFLMAGLCHAAVQNRAKVYAQKGLSPTQALLLAFDRVCEIQAQQLSIPRHYLTMARGILISQPFFQSQNIRDFFKLYKHLKFRAAYDFFCLRAQAGETEKKTAEWWTTIQTLTETDKKAALRQRYGSNKTGDPRERNSGFNA